MADINERIEGLRKQLLLLKSQQLQMSSDIEKLEKELVDLQISMHTPIQTTSAEAKTEVPQEHANQIKQTPVLPSEKRTLPVQGATKPSFSFQPTRELEDFIGTNVISKVGILITIIGVFVGAKYAIDKDLISPVLRIVLGYISAIILVILAVRLKPKYEYFSSILMGGGLAVAYFITYIAFSFYQLFPQAIAFILMVGITIASVGIALWYNKKIIALLGQIAAYAIPFILSNGSGNVAVLFAYISIINIGLLVLSFDKDWKVLYHIAFFLTYLIYAAWLFNADNVNTKFGVGITFLSINFLTFYATFLAYKIFRKQLYNIGEIAILLLNALLFFFLGAFLITRSSLSQSTLTLFTLINAAVHFGIGYFVYRLTLSDKTVFQFIAGLGLLFITIAIPIELDGCWVTLLWTIETTLLVYIGCTNSRPLYFDVALPLVVISLLSLLHDWTYAYPFLFSHSYPASVHNAFANFNFWSSIFVCACFGYITYVIGGIADDSMSLKARSFFKQLLPVIFCILLYSTFFSEIHLMWDLLLQQTFSIIDKLYQNLTLLIYSAVFVAALLYVNVNWIKQTAIQPLLLVAGGFVSVLMITKGFYFLGDLRENYLLRTASQRSLWMILVRYVCFLSLLILWLAIRRGLSVYPQTFRFKLLFSALFNLTLLAVFCNEFIHWMDMAGYKNEYKLGLTIICSIYALALIIVGIAARKKHLRIGGIFLFGLTLLKLFFYDLSSLSTISKTVVLLMLGILLLVASFLYNKYKDLLFSKDEELLPK